MEETKIRQRPRSACYPVHNLVSSIFLSKNIKIKIYITTNLPVLYGCEAWSFVLREERRLRVFQNRVQWKIFGPDRDEVIGMWRRLRKERNDVCSYFSVQIEKNWMGAVCRTCRGWCVHVLMEVTRGKETTWKAQL
jgi:hypothetical protein